jgi:hypothetical protein
MRKLFAVVLLTLVVAAAVGAGIAAWTLQQQIDSLFVAENGVARHLDRTATIVADIITSQPAYVVPGQADEPWLKSVSALLDQLTSEAAALKSTGLIDSTSALRKVDASARQNLDRGQDLMAADLILGEGRNTARAILEQVSQLRSQSERSFAGERAALWHQLWVLLGGAAAFCFLGTILGISAAKGTKTPERAAAAASSTPQTVAADREPHRPQLDGAHDDVLSAAAAICTEISRLTTAQGIFPVLARAAAVMDASGIILWMVSGDQLVAATGHGYDPRMIVRLPPIDRGAENATAAAWRTGKVCTVAGSPMSNGAVVAPMFLSDTCTGVLAAEVQHGREKEPATSALAALMAAQLAPVVAGWPTPGGIAQHPERPTSTEGSPASDVGASAIA